MENAHALGRHDGRDQFNSVYQARENRHLVLWQVPLRSSRLVSCERPRCSHASLCFSASVTLRPTTNQRRTIHYRTIREQAHIWAWRPRSRRSRSQFRDHV